MNTITPKRYYIFIPETGMYVQTVRKETQNDRGETVLTDVSYALVPEKKRADLYWEHDVSRIAKSATGQEYPRYMRQQCSHAEWMSWRGRMAGLKRSAAKTRNCRRNGARRWHK